MREPRSKQRFPEGGKRLYELMRMDHEPIMVRVCPSDELHNHGVGFPDQVVYERTFDPMLYFWPVEGQHVLAHFVTRPPEKDLKRLLAALERDGALWTTVMWRDENKKLRWENFGDVAEFMQRRYGVSLMDLVAVPVGRRGIDYAGAGAVPPDSRREPDRERQDGHGDGAAVSGP